MLKTGHSIPSHSDERWGWWQGHSDGVDEDDKNDNDDEDDNDDDNDDGNVEDVDGHAKNDDDDDEYDDDSPEVPVIFSGSTWAARFDWNPDQSNHQ